MDEINATAANVSGDFPVLPASRDQPGFLLFLLTFLTAFLSPLLFLLLQKINAKLFRIITTGSMWIFGFMFGFFLKSHYFMALWIFYTGMNLYMYTKSKSKNFDPQTPRTVYKYFTCSFKVNYFLAIAAILAFLVYSLFFVTEEELRSPNVTTQDRLLGLFSVALYFGVLNRDFAEICAETIAIKVGYAGTKNTMPTRAFRPEICAICNETLLKADSLTKAIERTSQLSCSHSFHDFCIKGWCLVGKKNVCPFCHEKVDLAATFRRPWEKVDLLYGGFLDVFRYFAGWLPLMVFVWKFNVTLFHLK